MSDALAAARRLIDDHKLYFEGHHNARCEDTMIVAQAVVDGVKREAKLREMLTEATDMIHDTFHGIEDSMERMYACDKQPCDRYRELLAAAPAAPPASGRG